MNKEELETAFNETTNSAVDLLKENIELKKKYEVMKKNAYILQERIDKAIEYIEQEEWNTDYDKKILNILKGDGSNENK